MTHNEGRTAREEVKYRAEQYQICQERGHKANTFSLSYEDWSICTYCGISFRRETSIVERPTTIVHTNIKEE